MGRAAAGRGAGRLPRRLRECDARVRRAVLRAAAPLERHLQRGRVSGDGAARPDVRHRRRPTADGRLALRDSGSDARLRRARPPAVDRRPEGVPRRRLLAALRAHP